MDIIAVIALLVVGFMFGMLCGIFCAVGCLRSGSKCPPMIGRSPSPRISPARKEFGIR